MECIKISETKEERKYYEDKKQKALHTLEDRDFDADLSDITKMINQLESTWYWRYEVREIIKKVNEIG